jgi:hypothetical protein
MVCTNSGRHLRKRCPLSKPGSKACHRITAVCAASTTVLVLITNHRWRSPAAHLPTRHSLASVYSLMSLMSLMSTHATVLPHPHLRHAPHSRGHHQQPTRGRLSNRHAEGLGQGGVHKDVAPPLRVRVRRWVIGMELCRETMSRGKMSRQGGAHKDVAQPVRGSTTEQFCRRLW